MFLRPLSLFLAICVTFLPSFQQRCITVEEGKALAAKENMFFIETSAKDSTNIEKAFVLLSKGKTALPPFKSMVCLNAGLFLQR